MKGPIPNSYMIPGTQLIAGEYPFALDPISGRNKLKRLLDAGVDVFVDLTTSDDRLQPYDGIVRELAGEGVELLRHPIPDMSVCDASHMQQVLGDIDYALAEDRTVYVHCWGGVGRTGTVIGCWLARHGHPGEEALKRVAALFAHMSEQKLRDHPWGSPQTADQKHMVRGWREPRFAAAQVRGALLGGAVGDALGAAVEFMQWPQIRSRFGADGIARPAEKYGRVGAITDDTQMTLWTAEGVLRGVVRANERGIGGPMSTLPHAYLRWLYTQERQLPRHFDETMRRLILGDSDEWPSGWLIGVEGLYAQRAPGNTCMSALKARELGTRERPLNDSKGCGTVMRVAPIGLFPGVDAETAFQTACESSALTHGHPTGWLAAGALVRILVQLREGMSLQEAVRDAMRRLASEPRHEETTRALERALSLWSSERAATPEVVESLGAGWTAEEALAIAVYAALVATGDFERGARIAVNHSVDSDSTGSIAGQLLGAMLGEAAIPSDWLEELELRDVITRMANDLAVGYRAGDRWWNRYPGY